MFQSNVQPNRMFVSVSASENGLSAAALGGMIVGSLLVVAVTIVIGVRGYRKRRRLSAEVPMTTMDM